MGDLDIIKKLEEGFGIEFGQDDSLTRYQLDDQGRVVALFINEIGIEEQDVFIELINGLKDLRDLRLIDLGLRNLDRLNGPSKLTTLRADENSIYEMGFLRCFPQLVQLWLSANKIDDLAPLRSLRQLVELNIGHNNIVDISPLASLYKLKVLDLGYNRIADISPLSELSGLEVLTLSNNDIKRIRQLVSLPSLTELDLSDQNVIEDLRELGACTKLTKLVVEDCEITDLSFVAGLRNLVFLNARNNEISDLSPIGKLTHLRELNLGGNKISDLSPLRDLLDLEVLQLTANRVRELAPLSNLKKLYDLEVSDNGIENIASLAGLTALQELDLAGNGIRDLTPLSSFIDMRVLDVGFNRIQWIDALREMTKLNKLMISGNKISDITVVGHFKELNMLFASENLITDISPLSCLFELSALSLTGNRVEDISPLEELTNLAYLYMDNNRITNIDALRYLRDLELLTLDRNPIEELSSWITELQMAINWREGNNSVQYYGITFGDNPLKVPPYEIIRYGAEAVRSWFQDERGYVNEVKVLLVGHGEVGKTTLVKRLTGAEPDPKEPPTHHIKISDHTLRYKGKDVALHFWDFGGQDVMHSTHQFFLSKRSVYILVLDGRRDEDAEYWLKHIESFGGTSPVLVVLNKIDTNPTYDLDRRFLQTKYPFIHRFYRTSCLGEERGIKELREGLETALDKVELLSIPWPQRWLGIKEELEGMRDDFISQEEYERICTNKTIDNPDLQEVLAEYLNDLGVVVHFKDLRLNDLHILQPRWASRAAYKIINSVKIADHHGVLKTEWMGEIMRKENEQDFLYQKHTFPYIIDLMQKFELLFPLTDGREYLIPELMSIQQPALPAHQGPVLEFFFQYEDLLPRSVLPRFIVRMHEDIKDALRWRTGVVLEVPIFQTLAIVIADIKERRINISVSGPQRREHFAMIRKAFHGLNGGFEKLVVTERVPLPDLKDQSVDYEELLACEQSGETVFKVYKFKKSYSVKDLLNGIEAENVRKKKFAWDVFISYSSLDKEVIQKIARDLQVRGIIYWIDEEQINPGDRFIQKITEGLQNSRFILPCISVNQRKSGWASTEYETILNKIISGVSEQRVLPLILDDTADADVPPLLSVYRCERFRVAEQYSRLLAFIQRNKQ